jgi:hypothetical protein
MLVLAGLALMLQFAGCAQVPKQAFNRAANQDVKKVALLKPAASGEFLVQNWGHPGMGFGLIGGIIAAADMQSKTTEFTTKMKAASFDPREEFTAALAQELRSTGYEVKVIEVKREKPTILQSYDALEEGHDAYVDCVLNWSGYFTASAVSEYKPAMRVLVRMVKRKTKEIAYQELVNYGYEMRASQAVNLTADAKYSFGNFSDLMAKPDLALEGMRTGIPLLARQVARDLALEDKPLLAATPPAPVDQTQAASSAAPPGAQPVALPLAETRVPADAQPQTVPVATQPQTVPVAAPASAGTATQGAILKPQ